ncbi:hypothetical protein [Shewanella sairae]|uniref:hypothetical protein n=1 Tax=Shewanella sairae TaxID=190310 RepID=UPI001C7FDA95|nr:hypothetical protein [Shewanella sairae]MCL1132721.1 hypothetical protein [Shewanella sairae]
MEIDSELLARLAELAASSVNDTAGHDVIKKETGACDNEIQATAYILLKLSRGDINGIPENIVEFNELTTAIRKRDFNNRFFR